MRWALIALIFGPAGSFSALAEASAAQPPAIENSETPAPDPSDAIDRLSRAGLDSEARLAEASALLDRAVSDRDLARAIGRAIGESGPDDPVRLAFLRVLGRSASAPIEIWPGLKESFEGDPSSEADRVSLLTAAGAFRNISAIGVLLGYASPERSVAERETAFASLRRLSGRSDLGQDYGAWESWAERMATLDEAALLRELLHWKAVNADEARRQRNAVTTRLVDTHRQLWLRQPPEGQSAFLASLLGDPLAEIRDLGISLVRQQLASARTLEPVVGEAALNLLKAQRASVRAEAASLVNQLAPEGGGGPVAEALAAETDPSAARALLGAAARWPSEDLLPPVLRWIRHGGRPASAAVETAWAMHRADVLPSGEARAQLLEALRGRPEEELNGAACRLMVAIGDESDHARVVALLRSEQAGLRLSAAEALVDLPGAIEALVDATTEDPDLFDAAARAVRRHRASPEGFTTLLRARSRSAEDRRAALLRVSSGFGMSDLVEASGLEGVEPLLAEAMLAGLVTPPGDEAGTNSRARATGLARLARVRIELQDFEGAITAIEAIPGERRESMEGLDDLKAIAYLCLGRLDEAREAGGSAAAWLDAMEMIVDRPFAPSALELLASLFGEDLSEPEQERYAALRARISPVNGEVPVEIETGRGSGSSKSGSG
ncbi:MAG: hypothetical protein EA423_07585 [Phycisphaerales bacterium]|nr:MAG: hypothetical protein EA423_07585 [Phycisphaerales bacterium]